jgi:predicted N-acetyltransferase YhbS
MSFILPVSIQQAEACFKEPSSPHAKMLERIDMDSTDNNGLVIRQIGPRDANEVSLLIDQLGYRRAPDDVMTWIERTNLDSSSQIAFVACLENEVIGWIEISLERRLQTPPFALIGGLVVKDGVRGRGIGRMLCERAEAWS